MRRHRKYNNCHCDDDESSNSTTCESTTILEPKKCHGCKNKECGHCNHCKCDENPIPESCGHWNPHMRHRIGHHHCHHHCHRHTSGNPCDCNQKWSTQAHNHWSNHHLNHWEDCHPRHENWETYQSFLETIEPLLHRHCSGHIHLCLTNAWASGGFVTLYASSGHSHHGYHHGHSHDETLIIKFEQGALDEDATGQFTINVSVFRKGCLIACFYVFYQP
jgi:hypothetical protein